MTMRIYAVFYKRTPQGNFIRPIGGVYRLDARHNYATNMIIASQTGKAKGYAAYSLQTVRTAHGLDLDSNPLINLYSVTDVWTVHPPIAVNH
jgi:hypothetical protein